MKIKQFGNSRVTVQCKSEKFAANINSVIKAGLKSKRRSPRQFTWYNFRATSSCSRSRGVLSSSSQEFEKGSCKGQERCAAPTPQRIRDSAACLPLEFCAAGRARERNHVANVRNAGDE